MAEAPSRTLHLVDASPYIFRAFFSLPSSMRSPGGQPINAVRGYADFLIRLLREEAPSHVLVAFDGSLTTSFRNDLYPPYKSSRELPDEDLIAQLDACYRVTAALGITSSIDERYEADDIVATARARFADEFERFVVVTADKDLSQLVDERTSFYDFAKGARLDAAGVVEKMGVRPEQVRDLLGLAGDSVDDIPGVRGVGPKTAVGLLEAFDDLDAIYANLDAIKTLSFRGAKTLAPKLEEHRDIAFLSRELATCSTDAPLELASSDLEWRTPDQEAADALSAELGLDSIARAARDL